VMSGERQDVEPDLVGDEVERSAAFGLGIQGGSSLQEHVDIRVGDLLGGDQDLEADHQNVGHFVSFEQTSVDVLVDVVSQVLDDLLHSLAGLLFLLGLVDRLVEEFQVLFQGRIVHPTDHGHVDDTEIECGTTDSHGSVLFSLLIDFFGLHLGIRQFDTHVLGLSLGQVEHVHQFGIVQKITLGLGQSFEEILF
jgi:hypothetical protein